MNFDDEEMVPVLEKEGNFVLPTIITGLPHDSPIVLRETFAPILYVIKVNNLDEAIKYNNEASQGLSSSLFYQQHPECLQVDGRLEEPSEVEKETGGGRESGSDSWRQYMR
ncbi:hypothetical protein OSTOST_10503, partial [Ostertagia ostertagi]